MPETTHSRETQLYASRLLNVMAGTVAKEVGSFATWFIAGAGALLAVVMNGAAGMAPYLQVGHLSGSIKLFLLAAGCNVLQRWLGAMVAGGVATAQEVEKLKADGVDGDGAIAILKNSSLWIVRWQMEKASQAVKDGDLVYGARRVARLSQWQSVLLLPQFGLLGWAAWRLLL